MPQTPRASHGPDEDRVDRMARVEGLTLFRAVAAAPAPRRVNSLHGPLDRGGHTQLINPFPSRDEPPDERQARADENLPHVLFFSCGSVPDAGGAGMPDNRRMAERGSDASARRAQPRHHGGRGTRPAGHCRGVHDFIVRPEVQERGALTSR